MLYGFRENTTGGTSYGEKGVSAERGRVRFRTFWTEAAGKLYTERHLNDDTFIPRDCVSDASKPEAGVVEYA
eukprot:scaffold169562_cov34-Prasinocladus_malaysianus.AAC.1